MAEGEEKKPLIVKKIKKGGGHGHHGGAWKVAYADFVTAMMAFFLLMWLLNATESEKLAGLADYFSPTIGVKDKMGIGFRGGQGPISEGIGADTSTNKGIVYGGVPAGPVVKVVETLASETGEPDAEKVVVLISEKIEEMPPQQQGGGDPVEEIKKGLELADTNAFIDLKQTPEGLEIQIRDKEGKAMFDPGSAELRPEMQTVLSKITELIETLPNSVSISGHTTSVLYATVKPGYTNWELSSDRANAAQRTMVRSGLQPVRIARIVARADNEPIDPAYPEAPVNDRVSIVLLRDSALPQHKRSAPDRVLLDAKDKDVKELIENEETAPYPEEKPVVDNSQLLTEAPDALDIKIDQELQHAPIESFKSIAPLDMLNVPPKKETIKPPVNTRLFEDKPDTLDHSIEQELKETQDVPWQSLAPLEILNVPEKKKEAALPLPAPNARLFEEKSDEVDKVIEQELQNTPAVPGAAVVPDDVLKAPEKEQGKHTPATPKPSPNARLFEEKPDAVDSSIEQELQATPGVPAQPLSPIDILAVPIEKKEESIAPLEAAPNSNVFEEQPDEMDQEIERELQDYPEPQGEPVDILPEALGVPSLQQ